MWLEMIAVSVWGGFVALDTTAAFQVMISRPIVSGSIVGLLLGDFTIGLSIGIVLELIWLNELPVGAAAFTEGNIGATVAAATAVLTVEQTLRASPSIALALITGVLISWLAGQLVIFLRNINNRLYDSLIYAKSLTTNKITCYHMAAVALSFVSGALLTGTTVSVCALKVFPTIVPLLPLSIDSILRPLADAFLGAGCGVLLYMFYNRKEWWLLAAGAVLGMLILYL